MARSFYLNMKNAQLAGAYENLTRESLRRAYVPANLVGTADAIAALVNAGLAVAVGANVIRTRASHSL